MADEKKTYTFRCTVCGYEVTVDTPELPEDYVCPSRSRLRLLQGQVFSH